MTCEIAVMNKFGVALAADSAVSLRNGEKVYHHAQKLFALKPTIPVGIMIYGSAELMGMPWEIVIRLYVQELGNKRFDHLEQYAEDFLRFTGNAALLFPDAIQREWFEDSVSTYWKSEVLGPLEHELKRSGCLSSRQTHSELAHILEKENAAWERHPPLGQMDDSHGYKIIANYGPVLNELEQKLFGDIRITPVLRESLHQTVKHMYTRQWSASNNHSGIVFVGMGETEPFAELRQYNIGSMAAGVLRWSLGDKASITRTDSAVVAPFAQTDMIDMFYRGIDEGLEEKLETFVAQAIDDELGEASNRLTPDQMESVKKRFRRNLNEEIDNNHEAPLMASVDALPRHDLAKMAEALINLTALRRHMRADQRETVGGQVDVAILSKGEGFVWVKCNGMSKPHGMSVSGNTSCGH